ncbi:MAG: T9SS type A sorting domain-containing protein [Saprospiraceae bacterium]
MPGGIFYWNSGGTVTIGSSGILTLINNSLTIKSGRTLKVEGEVKINSSGILIVKGTLDNIFGTVDLNYGGELILDKNPTYNIPGGNFNWNTGSTLTVGPNGHLTVSSSTTVPSGATLQVDGTMQINSAALTNNGTLTNNGNIKNFYFLRNYSGAILNNYATLNNYNGGTINNSQSTINNYSDLNNQGEIINRDNSDFNIENNGTLTNNGTFDNYSGGDVAINSGGTFTNNGTIDNTSTINLNAGGELILNTNLASLFTGFFNWLAGGNVTIGSSGEWTISSPLAIEPGSTLQVDGVLINENILTINGVVENNGTFTTAGYLINGTGSINGNIVNRGTLSPGSSPGCFTVNGDFEANGSSTLEIELADGSPCIDYDQIIVNGDAAIRGNINISFPSGTPSASTFTILTATGNKIDNAPIINWPAGFMGTGAFVGDEYQVSFALLPVELVFFQANKRDENSVELKWLTASEQNNRGFDIQRSNDGAEWENIGFVEGAGTTTEERHYSLIDRPNASGIFYYRLRQMDFDGKSEFSQVRLVKLENVDAEFKIFPNPATSFINIQLENKWEGELTLLLLNSIGQTVYAEKRRKPDEFANWTIDLSNFSNGIYQVIISDGKNNLVNSVIKRKN